MFITNDGRLLDLLLTESKLWAYLMQHPNQAVTASNLLLAVCGYEALEHEARAILNYHNYRLQCARLRFEHDPGTQARPKRPEQMDPQPAATGAGEGQRAGPEPSFPQRRRLRLHWGYLLAAVALAALLFVGSLLIFPDWTQTNGWMLVLLAIVAFVAVEFVANWRTAFDAPPDSKQ